jgi:hypothetical protein
MVMAVGVGKAATNGPVVALAPSAEYGIAHVAIGVGVIAGVGVGLTENGRGVEFVPSEMVIVPVPTASGDTVSVFCETLVETMPPGGAVAVKVPEK